MAETKSTDVTQKGDELLEAVNIVNSALTGLSPDFIRRNEKIVDNTRQVLADKLASSRHNDSIGVGKGSQVIEYVKIITSALRDEEKVNLLKGVKQSNVMTNPSGSHSIYDQELSDNTLDRLNDHSSVEELMAESANKFALMPEYGKIADIIPELGKAVEIIVKDVINRDEFSHRFITNFYEDDDDQRKTAIEGKIKDLLDEYDFESKIRRWLMVSEISGVKPFSVLPQDDVLFLLNHEIKKRKEGGAYTRENLIPYDVTNLISIESFKIKSPISHAYDSYDKFSTESFSSDIDKSETTRSVESEIDPYVDSIITDDLLDEYESVCLEEIRENFIESKINKMHDRASISKMATSMESFNEAISKPANRKTRSTELKKQLRELVVAFDRSVEVMDPKKGHLYQGAKTIKNTFYANKAHEIDKGIIEDFYRQNDSIKAAGNVADSKRAININGFEIELDIDPIKPDEYAKAIHNRRAILTEYEPEHVIPIANGGTHYGYYVVEYLRTSMDGFTGMKKDRGSFLDIVKRLGYGDDAAATRGGGVGGADGGNPFSSGVFSPSSVVSPVLNGNANGNIYGTTGQSNKKVELLKSVLIKTITKRLGDDSLIDNGTFQSALMNLIRDDVLFRNNIRFTFIPESHMVYMSRELDADGYPVSVFNGTLFTCYSYISSLVSSLMMKVMKSSNVEVMEINVGKSKEIGTTIGSIIRNSSTRNISARTLFGGTDSIVRSVGNFKTITIPVVDGEKLFDITNVEKVNDVEIDDEYTGDRLKSAVMKIGVPPSSLDMLSQDEYVASMTQHRIDFRNLIVDRGVNYSKFVTKAIKLLVNYSDIKFPSLDGAASDTVDKKVNQNEINIDIKKINFAFTPPKDLTVNKISEEISSTSALVDDIIKMYYGDDSHENKEWPILMMVTRKLLMKDLSSSTDWERIDRIIDEARALTPKVTAEFEKFNQPTIDGEDDSGSGDSDYGSDDDGGDDDSGGDFDFGGGDSGGDSDNGDDFGGDESSGGDNSGGDDPDSKPKDGEYF